jgi:hypothetical protein
VAQSDLIDATLAPINGNKGRVALPGQSKVGQHFAVRQHGRWMQIRFEYINVTKDALLLA